MTDNCGKTIFYGNDTGSICPETWDAIRPLHFDLVSLDCTMGTGGAYTGHLNLEGCFAIREQMLKPDVRTPPPLLSSRTSHTAAARCTTSSPRWQPLADL